MFDEAQFYSIWRGSNVFRRQVPQEEICSYAVAFSEWLLSIKVLLDEPTAASVNQSKVLLIDKFFEWYSYVPRIHRLNLGEAGHTCIFQVFLSFYQRIKIAELGVSPPHLFLPPKPQIPPDPPLITGIFIGEDLTDD